MATTSAKWAGAEFLRKSKTSSSAPRLSLTFFTKESSNRAGTCERESRSLARSHRDSEHPSNVLLRDRNDPQDPLNYTRAGLAVAFRPNKDKFTETEFGTSKNAAMKSFFSSKAYATEEELRRDATNGNRALRVSSKLP